jgi:hypothetical protein
MKRKITDKLVSMLTAFALLLGMALAYAPMAKAATRAVLHAADYNPIESTFFCQLSFDLSQYFEIHYTVDNGRLSGTIARDLWFVGGADFHPFYDRCEPEDYFFPPRVIKVGV